MAAKAEIESARGIVQGQVELRAIQVRVQSRKADFSGHANHSSGRRARQLVDAS